MAQKKRVFSIGSAHLEIIGKILDHNIQSLSNQNGAVTIGIGGAVCKLAADLTRQGMTVSLLTAIQKQSVYSSIIRTHIGELGINILAVDVEESRTPAFSAHIGASEEILSAVASLPISTAVFKPELIRQAMVDAQCAIIDSALSTEMMTRCITLATNMGIPVFIVVTSEAGAIRVQNIKANLSALFIRQQDAEYLLKKMGKASDLCLLSQHFNSALVILRDHSGLLVIEGTERTWLESEKVGGHMASQRNSMILSLIIENRVFSWMTLIDACKQSLLMFDQHKQNLPMKNSVEPTLSTLDSMATKDDMTGLFNRRTMDRHIKQAMHDPKHFSILLMDIDHFKNVNDTFGHDAGDETIKTIAEILKNELRGQDIPSRWGGEEFLCLLRNTEYRQALQVAERIRKKIEALQIPIVGKVTVSLGVAQHTSIEMPDRTIKRTDEALYLSKKNGRNKVTYRPSH
ncbi:MAG: diguanylate cyclase [Pseudomonadota bacterium]|nr:diguanylate cyclase [Pseudomonadota bacterium]